MTRSDLTRNTLIPMIEDGSLDGGLTLIVQAALKRRESTDVKVVLDATCAEELPLVLGVGVRIITLNGPAGCPEVELSGLASLVRQYVEDHWGIDAIEDLREAGEL